MALKISTLGLEDFAPDGTARMRIFILGDGDTGKSRWSSFSPKPIYAACEPNVRAISDRRVPAVWINNSKDFFDLLGFLQMECRKPDPQRQYQTIVWDTIDAFSRKVKLEWCEANRKDTFAGREAWAYLEQKLNIALTRLMNLDMHVIVLCHLRDKVIRDDENERESREMMARLQGSTADSIYDDFSLVGLIRTEWAAVEGKRTERRVLTFRKTPLYPMLKDNMALTPEFLPVTFTSADWKNLFSRIEARQQELSPATVVGEIPSVAETPSATVVPPRTAEAGPVPPQPEARQDLSGLSKPEIQELITKMGISKLADGSPIRANTLKSHLIDAIQAALAAGAQLPGRERPAPTPAAARPAPTPEPAPSPESGPVVEPVVEPEIVAVEAPEPPAPVEPEIQMEEAKQLISDVLGGQQIAEGRAPEVSAGTPAPASEPQIDPRFICEVCGKFIGENSGENPDRVRLAWIRTRRRLCNADFETSSRNG